MRCPFGGGRAPPRLPGRPLVGNGLEFVSDPLACLADGAARLGEVFRLDLLGRSMTVLSGPAADDLVRLGPEGPLDRAGLFRAFAEQTAVDLFTLEGEAHRRTRALVQRAYSRQTLGDHLPAAARTVLDRVRRAPLETTRMVPWCARLAAGALLGAITPLDGDAVLDDVGRFGTDIMGVTVGVRPEAIFRRRGFKAAKRRLEAFVDEAVRRRDATDPPTMIDHLLAARGRGGERLGPAQVRGACLYALCGAWTYLGPLAALLLHEIARDAELLTRVRAEVDDAFAVGIDPLVFRRMPWLRASWFELLRRYPVVFGLVFRARRAFDVDGWDPVARRSTRSRVEQGEAVLVTPVPGHFDPEVYPRPFSFEPRRFLGTRALPYGPAYAPFGVAPRSCAAVGMVELLLLTTVAAVLHALEIGPERPSYTAGTSLSPLPQPRDGLPMRLLARRAPPAGLRGALADMDLRDPFPGVPIGAGHLGRRPIVVAAGDAPDLAPDEVGVVLDGELAGPGGPLGPGDVAGWSARDLRATRRTRLLPSGRAEVQALLDAADLTVGELGRIVQWRHYQAALERAFPGIRLETTRMDLEVHYFARGEVVFAQGASAHHVAVLVEGDLEVVHARPDGATRTVGRLGAGEVFGEIGLLHARPRGATVRVVSEGAVVLALDAPTFDRLLADSPHARGELALEANRRLLAWIESSAAPAPA